MNEVLNSGALSFASLVVSVVVLVIGFALVALAQMLLANHAFDKFNNQLTGGTAPVRRGLAPKRDKLGRVIKD